MTPFPLTLIHLGQPIPASRHRTGRGHGYVITHALDSIKQTYLG